MHEDGKLDYLEMPGGDLPAVKAFYAKAFGWTFTDYGPQYASFSEGLDGGFYADATEASPAPLPVLYAADLEAMLARVQAAGATSSSRSSISPAAGASTSATPPAMRSPPGASLSQAPEIRPEGPGRPAEIDRRGRAVESQVLAHPAAHLGVRSR